MLLCATNYQELCNKLHVNGSCHCNKVITWSICSAQAFCMLLCDHSIIDRIVYNHKLSKINWVLQACTCIAGQCMVCRAVYHDFTSSCTGACTLASAWYTVMCTHSQFYMYMYSGIPLNSHPWTTAICYIAATSSGPEWTWLHRLP